MSKVDLNRLQVMESGDEGPFDEANRNAGAYRLNVKTLADAAFQNRITAPFDMQDTLKDVTPEMLKDMDPTDERLTPLWEWQKKNLAKNDGFAISLFDRLETIYGPGAPALMAWRNPDITAQAMKALFFDGLPLDMVDQKKFLAKVAELDQSEDRTSAERSDTIGLILSAPVDAPTEETLHAPQNDTEYISELQQIQQTFEKQTGMAIQLNEMEDQGQDINDNLKKLIEGQEGLQEPIIGELEIGFSLFAIFKGLAKLGAKGSAAAVATVKQKVRNKSLSKRLDEVPPGEGGTREGMQKTMDDLLEKYKRENTKDIELQDEARRLEAEGVLGPQIQARLAGDPLNVTMARGLNEKAARSLDDMMLLGDAVISGAGGEAAIILYRLRRQEFYAQMAMRAGFKQETGLTMRSFDPRTGVQPRMLDDAQALLESNVGVIDEATEMLALKRISDRAGAQAAREFMEQVVTNPRFSEMFKEIYLGALLSSPTTVVKSIVGTHTMQIMGIPESFAAAVMSVPARVWRGRKTLWTGNAQLDEQTVLFSESAAMAQAYVSSLFDLLILGTFKSAEKVKAFSPIAQNKLNNIYVGVRDRFNQIKAFRKDRFGEVRDPKSVTGTKVFGRLAEVNPAFGIANNPVTRMIFDAIGVVSRMGRVAIAWTDDLANYTAWNMVTRSAAVRFTAMRGEKLTQKNINRTYNEIVQNPQAFSITNRATGKAETVAQRAKRFARNATFAEPITWLGTTLRESVGGKLVMPFMTPTLRMAEKFIERVPVAALILPQTRAAIRAGGEVQAVALSKWAMGGMFATLGSYMNYEGYLTGIGPADPEMSRALRSIRPPNSLIFPTGKKDAEGNPELAFVDLKALGPPAFLLMAIVAVSDVMAQLDEPRQQDAAGMLLGFLSEAFRDVNFMEETTLMFSAINELRQGKTDKLSRIIAERGASIVPLSSLRRTGRKGVQEVVRAPETREDLKSFINKDFPVPLLAQELFVDWLIEIRKSGAGLTAGGNAPFHDFYGHKQHIPAGFSATFMNPFTAHTLPWRSEEVSVTDEMVKQGVRTQGPREFFGKKLLPHNIWQFRRELFGAGRAKVPGTDQIIEVDGPIGLVLFDEIFGDGAEDYKEMTSTQYDPINRAWVGGKKLWLESIIAERKREVDDELLDIYEFLEEDKELRRERQEAELGELSAEDRAQTESAPPRITPQPKGITFGR